MVQTQDIAKRQYLLSIKIIILINKDNKVTVFKLSELVCDFDNG